ncbi:MAG: sigma-54-dependent Fis family transcriptional regulator [Candidatus Riflebacteria bacterium]|nr:sigma-54-dependent Fis family transcriptional regulator [Candidatus Riflebacteria bacterium]
MRILIADDQPEVTRSIASICNDRGFDTVCVARGEEAVARVKAEPSGFALVILDYDFGRRRKNGLEAFREIKALVPELPVVFLTGQGTVAIAVEAMTLGAADFLEKDRDFEDNVEIALAKAQRLLAILGENRSLKEENRDLKGQVDFYKEELYRRYSIVGTTLKETLALVEKLAQIPRPVLIRGERGTGKELIAAAIHKASPRRGGPFVTVNCAALAEGLLECELFGQEENCYPGAPFRRGRFEMASRGTLFLDEVGNMPLEFQQKVLRVLEYQQFERVGGTQTIKVDVRIIAATNADLEAEMRRGRFREDLYDRLAFETIRLPPLRERPDDVPMLAAHFLNAISQEITGVTPKEFAPEALETLKTYPWHGNVRELKHYVERLAYRVTESTIRPEHLPPPRLVDAEEDAVGLSLAERTARFRRKLVNRALAEWGRDLDKVASSLGVGRSELEVMIREMGLSAQDTRSPLKRLI